MILPILRKLSPCRSLSQKYTLYKKKLSLKTLSICPSWLISGYLEGIFIGDVLTGPFPPVGSDTINLTHDHSDHHHEYTNQTKPQWSSSWLYKLNQTKPNHCDHHHYHYTNKPLHSKKNLSQRCQFLLDCQMSIVTICRHFQVSQAVENFSDDKGDIGKFFQFVAPSL